MATMATPYASASLYVGDLVPDVTEALLFETFNAVGPVASVRVCRDAATRRSLGYAYVNFHRVEDAERALDTMNFKAIRSRPCRIMWSHRDPSLRKSGLGNIFVKNLAKSIDNKSLFDTFSMFGNILSCKVATNSKRESLGYGFVHYESEESATQAIEKVNEKVIAGKTVSVQAFKSKKERGGSASGNGTFTNVYVKGLPEDTSDEEFTEMFAKFGPITSSQLVKDDENPAKTKGFGFVNYETPEEAAAACSALNGTEKNGRKLFVARAQKKDEREKELRERFEQLKVERQKKYEGVNLYVKNLSDETTEERLREEFKQFGTITSTKVMMDSQGKSKGFGFVCFASPEEASNAAKEMNNRMLDNKPLYVAHAQRKDVRRAHLEQQHNQRTKMTPHPQMYPPQGTPMFYNPGMPPRNFMYGPQQIMPRARWQQPGNPNAGPPQMLVGGVPTGPRHPAAGVNYQLMPISNRGGPPTPGNNNQRGGAGGRNRGRQQQGAKPGMHMNNQVRGMPNQPRQQQLPYQQQRPAQPEQPEPAAAVVPTAEDNDTQEPLTIKALAAAPEEAKKQMIGEHLFPLIKQQQPTLAGKITGMLLEMDNGELIHLLESRPALSEKISEAMTVLAEHQDA